VESSRPSTVSFQFRSPCQLFPLHGRQLRGHRTFPEPPQRIRGPQQFSQSSIEPNATIIAFDSRDVPSKEEKGAPYTDQGRDGQSSPQTQVIRRSRLATNGARTPRSPSHETVLCCSSQRLEACAVQSLGRVTQQRQQLGLLGMPCRGATCWTKETRLLLQSKLAASKKDCRALCPSCQKGDIGTTRSQVKLYRGSLQVLPAMRLPADVQILHEGGTLHLHL